VVALPFPYRPGTVSQLDTLNDRVVVTAVVGTDLTTVTRVSEIVSRVLGSGGSLLSLHGVDYQPQRGTVRATVGVPGCLNEGQFRMIWARYHTLRMTYTSSPCPSLTMKSTVESMSISCIARM
jgi:hypothetical protein